MKFSSKRSFGNLEGSFGNSAVNFSFKVRQREKVMFLSKKNVSSKSYIGNVEGKFDNLPESSFSNSERIHIIINGQNCYFLT